MNDDVSPLRTIWMSDAVGSSDDLGKTAGRVIDKYRKERVRERRLRIGGVIALSCVLPAEIWAAIYGVAPMVRAAYVLMAMGCVAAVSAEWLYLAWSRQALPGAADTRTQLQRTAFIFECQAWLARTALAWSSPVFIGVMLICVWLYRERTVVAAATLGAICLAALIATGVLAVRMAVTFDRRARQLERALTEFSAD